MLPAAEHAVINKTKTEKQQKKPKNIIIKMKTKRQEIEKRKNLIKINNKKGKHTAHKQIKMNVQNQTDTTILQNLFNIHRKYTGYIDSISSLTVLFFSLQKSFLRLELI